MLRVLGISSLHLFRRPYYLSSYIARSMSTPTTDPDCLFCKIVAGKIPCNKIYESKDSLAFIDIFPTAPGHCLVIPKYCAQRAHELPEASMADIGVTLSKVAKAVVAATGCEDYNILQNNGEIAHQVVHPVHFHIIPKPGKEQGLKVGWPSKKGDDEELKAMTARIVSKLDE
jgi:diadenosine tetraphosphate (Ap4A) HIT family hydrolase